MSPRGSRSSRATCSVNPVRPSDAHHGQRPFPTHIPLTNQGKSNMVSAGRDSEATEQGSPPVIAKRLYSIDALRGVGALAIVFWHWQHFWAVRGTWQAVWSRADEPFYAAFKPLYDQGWAAADIFFAVSGFVFFWLYLEPVAKREIGAVKFALQRFSRLYPLYVLTLLIATAMQF